MFWASFYDKKPLFDDFSPIGESMAGLLSFLRIEFAEEELRRSYGSFVGALSLIDELAL